VSSIVVVGSVAYDSVSTPFGVRERILGGSATYFSVAASYLAEVAVVAVVGEDFREEDREVLREKGVDLSGLVTAPGETFFWKGEYGDALNEARSLETRLGVFETFAPDLPGPLRDREVVFLANIDPELQSRVLDQVSAPRLVAADTMNFWIEGKPEALRRTLARVQLLLINDGEARLLAGEKNLLRAARAIRAMGPSTVVVKRGEHGVLVAGESGLFALPAYPLESLADPTGAGDTFAGGFVGYLARVGRSDAEALRRAAVYGTVLASFNVQSFSLERLRALTLEEIRKRYEGFRELTRFGGWDLEAATP
jgi:sugar/nucleoside kinase (ribokinase family)